MKMFEEIVMSNEGKIVTIDHEENIIRSIAKLNEEELWCFKKAIEYYEESEESDDYEDEFGLVDANWYIENVEENPLTHGWGRDMFDNLESPKEHIEIPYETWLVKFYNNEIETANLCTGYGVLVQIKDDEFIDHSVLGKVVSKYSIEHIVTEDGNILYGVNDMCKGWYANYRVYDDDTMVQKLLNTKPVYEAVQKIIDDENNKNNKEEHTNEENEMFDLPF